MPVPGKCLGRIADALFPEGNLVGPASLAPSYSEKVFIVSHPARTPYETILNHGIMLTQMIPNALERMILWYNRLENPAATRLPRFALEDFLVTMA